MRSLEVCLTRQCKEIKLQYINKITELSLCNKSQFSNTYIPENRSGLKLDFKTSLNSTLTLLLNSSHQLGKFWVHKLDLNSTF